MLAMMQPSAIAQTQENEYLPTEENQKSREEFADMRFGIFIHWGIYSTFAQGEWYMQTKNVDRLEYAKAARGFYPADFNAREWVAAIKASGAKYITITSRHHDGFSMWATKQSDYNIVDGTPFKRDIIKELSEECQKQGIRLHFYYSHLDWMREDYPMGRTGHGVGKNPEKADWASYYKFMNAQLTELLTDYGPIGAIWFDGMWDHEDDKVPFNWQLREQYDMIHRLQPSCLVGNNHHSNIIPGEDIQIFEKDLPGENTTGFAKSKVSISRLPLETCETMNGNWGYRAEDQNYKSAKEIFHLLVRTAGKGANLLMNIGPQPNGQLPATSLERLAEMGRLMAAYGETIYATEAGEIPVQPWGATTRKGSKLFVHILNHDKAELELPLTCKVKSARNFLTNKKVEYKKTDSGYVLTLGEVPSAVDEVIVLETLPSPDKGK